MGDITSWDGFVKPGVFATHNGVVYILKSALISEERSPREGYFIQIKVTPAEVLINRTTWGNVKPAEWKGKPDLNGWSPCRII